MIEAVVNSRDRIRLASPFWALVLAVCAGVGCQRAGEPRAETSAESAKGGPDFSTLYQKNCAGCHGADGKLGPAPPLNDPTFLAIVPDAVLKDLVTEGRPGTPMPAFARSKGGSLDDNDVNVIAKGIKARWGPGTKASAMTPTYPLTKTAADPTLGLKVFGRACASCHGANGEGTKNGPGAIRDPVFLALISDQCLRRYVITGRPELGMPDYAGKEGRAADFQPLTNEDVADLVALLASWRGDSPGDTAIHGKPEPKTAAR